MPYNFQCAQPIHWPFPFWKPFNIRYCNSELNAILVLWEGVDAQIPKSQNVAGEISCLLGPNVFWSLGICAAC